MSKYDLPEDNDIKELNKCPKCGALFDTPYCPICGEYCPEEMRAGNRKNQKAEKSRKPVKGASLVPFYLRWWFIILVSLISRIAAIILTVITDWKTWKKVLMIAVILLPYIFVGLQFVGLNIFESVSASKAEKFASAGLEKEEYIAKCQPPDYDELFSDIKNTHKGDFVTVTLTVISETTDYWYGATDAKLTYSASDEDGNKYCFTDYSENGKRLKSGQTVTVYGRITEMNYISGIENDIIYVPTIIVKYFG